MVSRRRPREGAARAREPPLPAVRERERLRVGRSCRGDAREGAQALALGRRRLQLPGQRRERPRGSSHGGRRPRRRAPVTSSQNGLGSRGPPSSPAASRTSTSRRVGARARRVEEVAVAARRRPVAPGGRRAVVELPAHVVVEERRGRARDAAGFPPRDRDEHDLEAPRACAAEVEHGDPSGRGRPVAADRRALERREHVVAVDRLAAATSGSSSSSVRETRVERGEIRRERRRQRRARRSVGVPEHRRNQRPDGRERRSGASRARPSAGSPGAELVSQLERPLAVQTARPRSRPRRSRRRAGKPGERRAEEGEELAVARRRARRSAGARGAPARRPSAESRRLSTDTGTPSSRRRSRAARAPRSTDGHTTAICSGARAAADERERLLGDELERSALAGALEEPHRAVERGAARRRVREERALEVSERPAGAGSPPRGSSSIAPARQRGEILDRPRERRERSTPRLVRERDRDLGARRERLEQRPLGAGQVLEAVGEHRRACHASSSSRSRSTARRRSASRSQRPRRSSSRRYAAHEARERRGKVLGLEKRRVDLARVPGGRRRTREARRRMGRRADVRGDARTITAARRRRAPGGRRLPPARVLEELVERPDRAGEQGTGPGEQVALGPLDVGTRSGRSATGRRRGARACAPAAMRPCPHAQARGRARVPSVHRSPAPPALRGNRTDDPRTMRTPARQRAAASRPEAAPRMSYCIDFGLRPRRATATPASSRRTRRTGPPASTRDARR